MLDTYTDHDLEHPKSSSLTIRLFHSSAIQTATAFRILNEAGLIHSSEAYFGLIALANELPALGGAPSGSSANANRDAD